MRLYIDSEIFVVFHATNVQHIQEDFMRVTLISPVVWKTSVLKKGFRLQAICKVVREHTNAYIHIQETQSSTPSDLLLSNQPQFEFGVHQTSSE